MTPKARQILGELDQLRGSLSMADPFVIAGSATFKKPPRNLASINPSITKGAG